MVKIKAGKFEVNLLDEVINTRLNIESMLTLMMKNKIISEKEFIETRRLLLDRFKKIHPEIFITSDKESNKNGNSA